MHGNIVEISGDFPDRAKFVGSPTVGVLGLDRRHHFVIEDKTVDGTMREAFPCFIVTKAETIIFFCQEMVGLSEIGINPDEFQKAPRRVLLRTSDGWLRLRGIFVAISGLFGTRCPR